MPPLILCFSILDENSNLSFNNWKGLRTHVGSILGSHSVCAHILVHIFEAHEDVTQTQNVADLHLHDTQS